MEYILVHIHIYRTLNVKTQRCSVIIVMVLYFLLEILPFCLFLVLILVCLAFVCVLFVSLLNKMHENRQHYDHHHNHRSLRCQYWMCIQLIAVAAQFVRSVSFLLHYIHNAAQMNGIFFHSVSALTEYCHFVYTYKQPSTMHAVWNRESVIFLVINEYWFIQNRK